MADFDLEEASMKRIFFIISGFLIVMFSFFFIACPCEPGEQPILEGASASINPTKEYYNLDEEILLTLSFQTDYDLYESYEVTLSIKGVSEENEEFTKKIYRFSEEENCKSEKIQKSFYLKSKEKGKFFYTVSIVGDKNYANSSVEYYKRFIIRFN